MNKETQIYILFEDEDVRLVFSELLEALGRKTQIINNPSGLPENASVVTEPAFYKDLLPIQRAKSLVIGNKNALTNIETPTLSRPLTEEKIEAALATFEDKDRAKN